jgi:hypothetical protein
MTNLEVKCTKKLHRGSPHERITHLGIEFKGGFKPQKIEIWSSEEVIRSIELGHTFYTLSKEGKRAEIKVVKEGKKSPYLRTCADGVWNNNLLDLDKCH